MMLNKMLSRQQQLCIRNFCTLRRTYNRIHAMRNDVSCPKREIRDEIAFVESLECELDNTIAPMHNIVYKAGFWAMLSAFITAQEAKLQEIATMHSITLGQVNALFFKELLNACCTLQNTHVSGIQWWMRLPFMYWRIPTTQVPIAVFGQDVALLKWRNQCGVMNVFEIGHNDDMV